MKTDDVDTALLAGLPPATWAETLKRQAVLRAHVAAAAEGREDIAATAEALGLAQISTQRLVRAFEQLQRGRAARAKHQGVARRIPQGVTDILAQVRQELVGQLSTRALVLEAARRCRAAGLKPPSEQTLRVHLLGSPVTDLTVVLGRRFEAVVDACPLLLDVKTQSGTEGAVLAVVLRASDAKVLSQHLSAGRLSADALAALLRAAASQLPPSSPICATDAVRLPDTEMRGLSLDRLTGLGLSPGAAITAALGMRIGKIRLRPRRRGAGGGDAPEAVPVDAAKRVIARLLQVPDAGPIG